MVGVVCLWVLCVCVCVCVCVAVKSSVSLRPLTTQQKLRWGFVALLVVLGVITGTVTSPIMIYWFSAYLICVISICCDKFSI
eukprot:COSAG05_NODE_74_length_21769_cov_194.316290_6_plen_82_part_00